MQQHLLQENFTSILHTQGNHGEAVTNEDNFHASNVCDMPTGEVMGCKDGDGLSLLIHRADGIEGNFLPQVRSWSAHGRM
jgi:hypothetical protein